MRNLDEVKTIAEQMLALSAKLLQLIDMDDTERRRFVEEVKKMHGGRFCIFPAL